MKRLCFITGRPGIGKTTVLLNAANGLKDAGYVVGGMITREVRHEGSRIGFEVIDLSTNKTGWLAHIDQLTGPQVSRYRVNLNDLNNVGVKAIQSALKTAEVIIIDEIGPMELFSQMFQQAIRHSIESQKLVLGVIHQRARDPIINSIMKRVDAEILEVTIENRQRLHNVLIQKAVQFLDQETNRRNKG